MTSIILVPKGWFNQYKFHRASVREPFIHLLFFWKTQLPALNLGQTSSVSATLEKGVQKLGSTHCASEKPPEKTSQILYGVFTLPHQQDQVQWTKHLKYITENKGSHSLGTQSYLLLQETIRCVFLFQWGSSKKEKHKPFKGVSTIPYSI